MAVSLVVCEPESMTLFLFELHLCSPWIEPYLIVSRTSSPFPIWCCVSSTCVGMRSLLVCLIRTVGVWVLGIQERF